MAPSPLVAATLQSAALGALSNVLAQVLTAYKTNAELSIDWIPVFQFLLFGLISTPPNFLWQDFLESTFPANPRPPQQHPKKSDSSGPPPPSPSQPKLSIRNTLIKFLLDQTAGATVNTLLFSTFTHSLRRAMAHVPRVTGFFKALSYWTGPGAIDLARVDFGVVLAASLDEFWAIFTAGWTLWPAVSIVNFTLVKTVEGRNLVGALAGVAWGIYMSLVAAKLRHELPQPPSN